MIEPEEEEKDETPGEPLTEAVQGEAEPAPAAVEPETAAAAGDAPATEPEAAEPAARERPPAPLASRFIPGLRRGRRPGADLWESTAPVALEPTGVTARFLHGPDALFVRLDQPAGAPPGNLTLCLRTHQAEVAGKGGWRLRVAGNGTLRAAAPPGEALAQPQFAAQVETEGETRRVWLELPYQELAGSAEPLGTPCAGTRWSVGLLREGEGPAARWPAPETAGADGLGELELHGGPVAPRLSLELAVPPFYGVNLFRFRTTDTNPNEVVIELEPPPAARQRSRDQVHYKVRLAKPGPYRLQARVPARTGKSGSAIPPYALSLVFTLPDVWTAIAEMERTLAERQAAAGDRLAGAAAETLEMFERLVLQADGYRAPHAKERMEPGLLDTLRMLHDEILATLGPVAGGAPATPEVQAAPAPSESPQTSAPELEAFRPPAPAAPQEGGA